MLLGGASTRLQVNVRHHAVCRGARTNKKPCPNYGLVCRRMHINVHVGKST